MANTNKNTVDIKILKTFALLGDLSLDKLEELAEKSSLSTMPANRIVFRQGEKDKRIIFLLSGQLELAKTGNPKVQVIRSKTADATSPIAEAYPREISCKTKTECKMLHIDRDLLELLLDDDTSGFIEVEELGDDDENAWMIRFLESRSFLQLPTENIQSLLTILEEVPVQKGEVVIQQGAQNEFYYIVQKGRCAVSRRPAPNTPEMQLAILKVGDGFGEEALITGGKRNASITMLDDGVLMRLTKEDFMSLLAKPLIKKVDKETALEKVSHGSLLIDVRIHDEYIKHRVEGSVNIPLSMLRVKLDGFNLERDYVLLCDDGARSSAAAFLLSQNGLNCFVLDGGLNKNDLVVPDANLSSKVPTSQSKESIAAERSREAAELKTAKIQKEANTAKIKAKELAKRQADAEAAKRKADAEIARQQKIEAKKRDTAMMAAKQRLNEESKRAKQAEEEAAKLKLEAKNAKRKAEQELKKLREETNVNQTRQHQLDSALSQAKTIAAEAAKASENARQKASNEAAKIRAQAQVEAEHLRQEMEGMLTSLEQKAKLSQAVKTEQHKAELKKARSQALDDAEKIKQQARREAESIRAKGMSERKSEQAKAVQEANKIADQIRQQALLEAEQLREDMAATKRAVQEEETTRAKQEADEIRQIAIEEANILRSELDAARRSVQEEAKHHALQEAEAIRQRALQDAEKVRAKAEAENNRSHEAFRHKALQEAEDIKQQAIQEAEDLRTEMEAAKNEAQEIAESIAEQEYEQRQLLEDARLHAEQVVNSKSADAIREADLIRREATLESERLRSEIQDTRKLLAEQVANARVEISNKKTANRAAAEKRAAENLQQKKKQIKQKTEAAKKEQLAMRNRKATKAADMQRKAEAIKARLEKAEKLRQKEEAELQSEGMSLNKASLKKLTNRIILEGDQDIFIFKEPTLKPEDVEKEETVDEIIKEDNELPSFIIDTPEDADYIPVTKDQISDTYDRFIHEENESKKKQQVRMFAIAATVLLSAILGVSMFIFQPEDQTSRIVNRNSVEPTRNASITDFNKSSTRYTPNKMENQKQKLKKHAEKRFDRLMKTWEKQSQARKRKEVKIVLPQEPVAPVFPDRAVEAAEVSTDTSDTEVTSSVPDESNDVSLNTSETDSETSVDTQEFDARETSDSPDTASSLLDNLDNLN